MLSVYKLSCLSMLFLYKKIYVQATQNVTTDVIQIKWYNKIEMTKTLSKYIEYLYVKNKKKKVKNQSLYMKKSTTDIKKSG